VSTPLVIDASAAVEMIARTTRGAALRSLVGPGSVPWVPDGLFDAEVLSVLRRWDLRSVLTPDQVSTARLRLRAWRLRRVSVRAVAGDSWNLRHNLSFTDGCYVALAARLNAPLLTDDFNLVNAPTLAIATLHLPPTS
jgi:predicted nucleic acid-binding protein